MKDLYTFDASEELAEATYNDAKQAYTRIFDRVGLPYLVVSAVVLKQGTQQPQAETPSYQAEADTGNIGGSSSHEFHYASPGKQVGCRIMDGN